MNKADYRRKMADMIRRVEESSPLTRAVLYGEYPEDDS